MSNGAEATRKLDDLRAERLAALNLIEDTIRAREKAERAEATLRIMAGIDAYCVQLADALSPLASADEVKSVAAHLLGTTLHVDRVYYAEVERDDEHLVVPQTYFSTGKQPSITGRYRIADFGERVFQELRENRAVAVADARQSKSISVAQRGAYQKIQTRAFIAHPLMKAGRLVAVLGVTQSVPRTWLGEEIALVAETVERTWSAVERSRAEEAIRANEEQFRRAIEDAPIPVVMHAEDGQILQVSRAWSELTGFKAAEVTTFESWLTHASESSADQVQSDVRKLFRGQTRRLNTELDVITLAGKRRWAFSASAPGRLRDGRRYIVSMAVDITERAEKLREANDELRALSKRLVETQESERRRLAETLHDDIGQVLTALNLAIKRAHTEKAPAALTEAEALVADLLERVRRLSTHLRPHVLDNLGLAIALRWHVKNFSQQTKIPVSLRVTGVENVKPDLATTVFRLVQEALTNVARHSGAKHARVAISRRDGTMKIEVHDNGRGFDPENLPADSSGLLNLRQRVRLSGGALTITSDKKTGTLLKAVLPSHSA